MISSAASAFVPRVCRNTARMASAINASSRCSRPGVSSRRDATSCIWSRFRVSYGIGVLRQGRGRSRKSMPEQHDECPQHAGRRLDSITQHHGGGAGGGPHRAPARGQGPIGKEVAAARLPCATLPGGPATGRERTAAAGRPIPAAEGIRAAAIGSRSPREAPGPGPRTTPIPPPAAPALATLAQRPPGGSPDVFPRPRSGPSTVKSNAAHRPPAARGPSQPPSPSRRARDRPDRRRGSGAPGERPRERRRDPAPARRHCARPHPVGSVR